MPRPCCLSATPLSLFGPVARAGGAHEASGPWVQVAPPPAGAQVQPPGLDRSRLARPKVPPASGLTPTGSETFAVTVAAGPEPVLSTLNPTMPVAPCDSVPTGLIRAAICACEAGAVDGEAGDVPVAAFPQWIPGTLHYSPSLVDSE